MKNFLIIAIIALTSSTAFAQYFEGTITSSNNFLIFSIRPKPGGGNIVISEGKQIQNIEFCVRYPESSAPFSWGVPVTGPSFSGATFQYKGTDEYGAYSGKKLDRFQWITNGTAFVPSTVTSDPLTNVTYMDGTVYEVFRVPLIGATATVDFELVHNESFSPAYIAITDRDNVPLDVTSVGTGNALFGPGFNIDGSDQIVPLIDVPVPVKFLGFDVVKKDNDAILNWSVENEDVNTDKYIIERSVNSVDFQPLVEIPALKNGRSNNTYSSTQKDIASVRSSGVLYFRIKQVDKDGKFVYTSIKSVRLDSKTFAVRAYPNPVKSTTTLTVDLVKDSKVLINVTDANGKQVKSIQFQGFKGANIKSVNLNELAGGNYLLKVHAGEEIKTISIAKVN